MENRSVLPSGSVEAMVDEHGDLLFRICFVMLGNAADAEDAVQETVIRYFQKSPHFESEEHRRAWLITAAKNKCKDMLRFRRRHPTVELDHLHEVPVEPPESGILQSLMSLPDKFRLVLTLYYVEGYRTEEIARIIQKTPSAVKMRLQKGRRLLEEEYRKEQR